MDAIFAQMPATVSPRLRGGSARSTAAPSREPDAVELSP
jgi:hypothetical protein